MLILVTWRWRTQTERVWQSSVVNTSTTTCCHQRHTHEPVGGDRLSHRMNIGPTITVYLKMSDKNSSSSQILRCCAQWEHTLDSLQAQVGSDTRRPTTRQHHRPTPILDAAACSYHVGSCMIVTRRLNREERLLCFWTWTDAFINEVLAIRRNCLITLQLGASRGVTILVSVLCRFFGPKLIESFNMAA